MKEKLEIFTPSLPVTDAKSARARMQEELSSSDYRKTHGIILEKVSSLTGYSQISCNIPHFGQEGRILRVWDDGQEFFSYLRENPYPALGVQLVYPVGNIMMCQHYCFRIALGKNQVISRRENNYFLVTLID